MPTAEVGRPAVGVGYTRSELVTRVPSLPDARRDLQLLSGNTTYGGPGFTLSTRYLGTLSTGTYAADRYDEHRVDANVSANVTDRTEARIDDSYYLENPHGAVAVQPAPGGELPGRRGHQPPRADRPPAGDYTYSHGLQSVPGSPDVERTAHRLGLHLQRTLSPEWRLRSNVDGNFAIDRTGTREEQNAAQSLGLTAYWQRLRAGWGRVDAYAGPTLGVVEPQHADAQVGFGGLAGASVVRNGPQLDLQAGVRHQLGVRRGPDRQVFRQQARGSAQAPYGLVLVRGQLTLLSERHDVRGVGAGGLRSIGFSGSATVGRFTGSIDGTMTDGVSTRSRTPARATACSCRSPTTPTPRRSARRARTR